jgi:hypothetical protein
VRGAWGRGAMGSLLAFGMLSASGERGSRADETDPCLSAPVDGQKLQKAGKLLAARDKFTACARNTCPGEIVQDCTRWAGEVDAALPTVVMAARDQAGHDLADVTVAIDGAPPVALSARSASVDPGPHTFVFRRGAGTAVEQTTILREGEKNREVVAIFGLPGAAPRAPTTLERPVPVAAWVSAAVGVAGLGVLAVAGSIGVSDRSSEHCDTGCTQSQKNGVDSLFLVADVGMGVGIAGVALATVLFLARPTVERPASSAYVDLRPLPGGGAAFVGGRF